MIDETTGFPVPPEGHYWRVDTSNYFDILGPVLNRLVVKLCTDKTVEDAIPKRWPWSRKRTEEKMVRHDVAEASLRYPGHSEDDDEPVAEWSQVTNEMLLDAANRALESFRKREAEAAARERLQGNYPPKSLKE